MLLAVAVGLGGSVGALSRYLADRAVKRVFTGPFPVGTSMVNLLGSFVLGILAGMTLSGLGGDVRVVVGVGFCGGLTTWSAASWETVRLAEEGMFAKSLLNGFGGLAAACVAGGLGLWLG